MSKSVNKATRAAAAKRAPGNAAALQQKAADNMARQAKGRGKAETITVLKNTTDGAYVYVEGSKGSHFTRLRSGDSKAFRAAATMGALYDKALAYHQANPAPKPQARLAQGVDSHNSPQSAKAVADQRKGAAKAEPTKGKGGKARVAKADKAKQPSKGANRSYAKGTKKNEARPDTWRFYMLQTIMGAKDMDSAKAAHAKSGKYASNKLDFTWADQQGYIKFAK